MAGIRLPDHSHCKFCGDPIPFGEEFCNEGCRMAEAEREKKEKQKEYLFWGSAAAVILVIMVVGMLTKF